MNESTILKCENLTKIYGNEDNKTIALDDVSFSVKKGQFVSIIGASGSGKSTLLHLLGGVDKPTSGKVIINNIDIHPFSIPHDARDPVSYQIETADARIGTVTDLGYFDEAIIDELKDCDLLYVEANYDLHMLEVGPYPYQLKRRIAGNYGHLCNEMSGQLVGRLLNERLQQVILGHLSKENNFPELALRAVQNELERDFSVTKEALHISVAPRDEARALITL